MRTGTTSSLLAWTALCCFAASSLPAQTLRSHDYTARVDADGRISLDHRRTPVITTSYAGMFGRLPSGSPMYWINASRKLTIELPEADPPRLVAINASDQGVTMRREVTILPTGVRLTHEIVVPAGLAGSIDTGFTLSPELCFGAPGTLWNKPGAEGKPVRLGADAEALPYQTAFHKLVCDNEWGRLTIEFEGGEGLQPQGALLNGAKSTRRAGEWVQVLPLFTGVAADQPQTTYRSSCLIRFAPAPGKQFLSPRRNVLYGGDFEAWHNPDLPDGWRRDPRGTPENSAGLAPDEQVKFEGARSLRFTLPAGALTCAHHWRNYYAPVTMDGPYVFSVYLRSEPAGVQATLRCGGKTQPVQATGDWQRFAVGTAIKTGQPLPAISLRKLSPGTL
jgi:hypothetical protein